MKKYILYREARPVIKALMKTIFRVEIINSEIIPKDGKCILAGNHTSNLDPLLLITSTKRTIRFLAKKELHKGLLKPLFLNAGTIPVNRKIKDKNVKVKTIEALNNEELVCIFPEGTINKTNNTIMPFKYGTVVFAKTTSSTIIPFTITGKYKLFKKSVRIEFLSPIKIESEDLQKENEKLMNIIKTKLEEKK